MWSLKSVLRQKYNMEKEEAELLSDFILKMIRWEPICRATAQELLKHPWLTYKAPEKEGSSDSDGFVTESDEEDN